MIRESWSENLTGADQKSRIDANSALFLDGKTISTLPDSFDRFES